MGLNPAILIGNMYQMPCKDESIDRIIGLSSWDSQYLTKDIMRETFRSLKPGGRFIHVQDVAVPSAPIMLRECERRKDMGLSAECKFLTGVYAEVGGATALQYSDKIESSLSQMQLMDSEQFLHDELARWCEEQGMTIEQNEQRSASELLSYAQQNAKAEKYRRWMTRPTFSHNIIELHRGLLRGRTSMIDLGGILLTYTAYVLVATKK